VAVARKTDATPVRGKSGADKFLFYDALTLYDPGVEIRWKKGDRVQLRAPHDESLKHVFAVRVKDGACSSAYLKELAKGDRTELDLREGKPRNLAEILVEAGLYRKEAEGLVEIWDEEFFRFDGARILTLVSRNAYDALLPLSITPEPRELRRVLLAHVECLDPEVAASLEPLAEQLGSEEPRKRDAATAQLRARMPLAAQVLRDALAKARDPEVRARLEDLLRTTPALPQR
jgi:hypothetical protein